MNIMCVFYRFGAEIPGGAERHFHGLAHALAARGHQVDVYTTATRDFIVSEQGALRWDNRYTPGLEQDAGVRVCRFAVENLPMRRAQRFSSKVERRLAEELASRSLAESVAPHLETGQGYLLGGWHAQESWEGHAVRWTGRRASLAYRGDSLEKLKLSLYAPLSSRIRLDVAGTGKVTHSLAQDAEAKIEVDLSGMDCLACTIEIDKTFSTPQDTRTLGVAIKSITLTDSSGECALPLSQDFQTLLYDEPEPLVAELLWHQASERPNRYSRYQRQLIGPNSPDLAQAVMEKAACYDAIVANMIPMRTMEMAARAAQRHHVPLLLCPLYHPRDKTHYWKHVDECLRQADLVDANSPALESLLQQIGCRTVAIGPGFHPSEFASPEISGDRFKARHNLEGRKIILCVGRKKLSKRLEIAISAVSLLSQRGWPAHLVLIGRNEDGLALEGEHILDLDEMSRPELLDAYAACDMFMMPSTAESFGMAVCEAWLSRKPVIGNRNCLAIASLIQEGVDGWLAATPSGFADAAERLLQSQELADSLAEQGRAKVLREFTWEEIAARCEQALSSL